MQFANPLQCHSLTMNELCQCHCRAMDRLDKQAPLLSLPTSLPRSACFRVGVRKLSTSWIRHKRSGNKGGSILTRLHPRGKDGQIDETKMASSNYLKLQCEAQFMLMAKSSNTCLVDMSKKPCYKRKKTPSPEMVKSVGPAHL